MEFGALAQLINNDMLDNLISVVVVILTLSLLVQAIQMFVKKLLRIKSGHLEDSLIDLFAATLDPNRKVTLPKSGLFARLSSLLRLRATHLRQASKPAADLYRAVVEEFGRLGRVTALGRSTLESLSKEDLLRIVARIGIEHVAPDAIAGAKALVAAAAKLDAALASIDRTGLPAGTDAKLARVEALLAPTLRTAHSLGGDGTVSRSVMVSEVVSLATDDLGQALVVLGELQETLGYGDGTEAMKTLRSAVSTVVEAVRSISSSIDKLVGPLRANLDAIGTWFDTVMQSFSERYERSMRTWTLVISAIVVVWLNANVFTIYTSIAKNDLLRSHLGEVGKRLLDEQKDIEAAEHTQEGQKKDAADATEPTAVSTELEGVSAGITLDTDSSAEAHERGTVTEDDRNADPAAEIAESREEIRKLVGLYAGFGFEPLRWNDVTYWFDGLLYRDQRAGETWGDRRIADGKALFGWLVMILLLGIGAPFWHDALESLFGVKNLLQQRTGRKNVEQQSGAGNLR